MGLMLNGVAVEVLIKQGHLEINTASRHTERAERAPQLPPLLTSDTGWAPRTRSTAKADSTGSCSDAG